MSVWRALATAALLWVPAGDGAARADGAHWLPAWIASAAPPRFDVVDGTMLTYRDQTIRQDVRLGVSARVIRIRLSNELGMTPVRLRSVRLKAQADDPRGVTFSGHSEVTIPPGVALISDPVAMLVQRGGVVTVSLHVPDEAPGVVRRTPVRLGTGDQPVGDGVPIQRRQGFVSVLSVQRELVSIARE